MSHIPYYGEDEESRLTINPDIFISHFGPWKNRHGFKMEFIAIDDMFMLKTVRPDRKKLIEYFWDEDDLEQKIDIYNQNRYF